MHAAGSLVAVARRSGKIDVLGTDAGALQGTAPAVPWEPDMASQSRQVTGLSFLSHDAVTSPRYFLQPLVHVATTPPV